MAPIILAWTMDIEQEPTFLVRTRIFKHLRSIGISSKESIPPICRTGNLGWLNRFLGMDSWAP